MNLRYETKRLILAAGNDSMAGAVADYLTRNREDFSRYDVEMSDEYYTADYQARALKAELHLLLRSAGCRFYLFLKKPSDDIRLSELRTSAGIDSFSGTDTFGASRQKEELYNKYASELSRISLDKRRIIGNISFAYLNGEDGHQCTLGYKIDSDYRRRGYAYEAASFLLDIVTSEFSGINLIEADILPENRASLALIKKLNFEYTGLKRSGHNIAGMDRDNLKFAWTRS